MQAGGHQFVRLEFVGLEFRSVEGEINPSAGLQVLSQGCLDVVTPSSCTGSWYVRAPQGGTYLLIATSDDFAFTVKHAYAVSAAPAGTALHVALRQDGQANDGNVYALVSGASDSSHYWTEIHAAWTVTDSTGAVPTTISISFGQAPATVTVNSSATPGKKLSQYSFDSRYW